MPIILEINYTGWIDLLKQEETDMVINLIKDL